MLKSSEVTLAVCVKYKTILSINMANHHHIRYNSLHMDAGSGSIMCVFGKHDPSTCTLYLHPLILANPNEIRSSAAPTASQVDKKMSSCRMFLLTKLPIAE